MVTRVCNLQRNSCPEENDVLADDVVIISRLCVFFLSENICWCEVSPLETHSIPCYPCAEWCVTFIIEFAC